MFDDSTKPSRICQCTSAGRAACNGSPARGVRKSILQEIPMKGLDQKKSDKKKPAKTMKEKRAEKQSKKAAKGR